MASTESTVKKKEQNPLKHTSDVRKPETQIRQRGYEYYVRAEILQAYVHACVIVLQYNTPVNDLSCKKVRQGKTRAAQSHQQY